MKPPGLYKFVVIGSYDVDNDSHHRELRVFDHNFIHKSQVKEGERAISAGTVGVFDTYWKIIDGYSTSLNVGYDALDIPLLTEILGVPFQSEYDFTFWSSLL
jgi:hypothetical protein